MAVTFEIRYRILCNFIGFVVVSCSIFGQISILSVPITDSAANSPNGGFDWLNLDNVLQHFDRPCSCVYNTSGVTSITQLRNCVMKILPNIIFFRQSCNKQKHHTPID